MNRYSDIINFKYSGVRKHEKMSAASRAAQFAPFASLTGHSDMINETGRLTSQKRELTEDIENDLNEKLNFLIKNIRSHPFVKILYFLPDEKKQGGRYIEISDNVKKIDLYGKILTFSNKTEIDIENICSISM